MGTFNVPGLGISATGAASTFGTVTATQVTAPTLNMSGAGSDSLGGAPLAQWVNGTSGVIVQLSAASHLDFWGDVANSVARIGRITNTGVLAWGTTVTTGAGPGNIVLPNGIGYCSANAAGTSILALLNADSSNRTVLRTNGVRLVVANALTSVSAPSNGTAAAPPTNPYGYLLANVAGQDVGIPMYIL